MKIPSLKDRHIKIDLLWPKESVPTKTTKHSIDSYELLEFLEYYKLGPKSWYLDVSKLKITTNYKLF